eukprot:m.245875 g.245875  ORF g.245875 m.245875 type:complete len:422 (+) comp39446_c0_seq1:152-1417(+)
MESIELVLNECKQREAATVRISIDNTANVFRASAANILALLRSAAREILVHAAVQEFGFPAVHVYAAENSPITLFKPREQDGATEVGLTSRETYWGQYSFQFAHELCHTLVGHTDAGLRGRLAHSVSCNDWFEESLCEMASLFTLRAMGRTWQVSAPYSNWTDFAPHLTAYAAQRIDTATSLYSTALEHLGEHQRAGSADGGDGDGDLSAQHNHDHGDGHGHSHGEGQGRGQRKAQARVLRAGPPPMSPLASPLPFNPAPNQQDTETMLSAVQHGTLFATWLEENLDNMRDNSCIRACNDIVAVHLLPIFEAHPIGFLLLRFLNTSSLPADCSLTTRLHAWIADASARILSSPTLMAKSAEIFLFFNAILTLFNIPPPPAPDSSLRHPSLVDLTSWSLPHSAGTLLLVFLPCLLASIVKRA